VLESIEEAASWFKICKCYDYWKMSNTYFLSENYLLKGAPIGDVDSVQVICDFREFGAGDPIVTVQDKNQDIMIVIEGRARVETVQGDVIDELRAGAMIGEISFLDGKPRTANVYAVGPAKVAVIPAARLRDLMAKTPRLEVTIYRNAALALCERLRDANQQIESLLVPR
jgi:CRP-like cAMP-binding protein